VHYFQKKKQLREDNSIPRDNSPLARFLDRFLIKLDPARPEENQTMPVHRAEGAVNT
jgi:hypothetical protein